MNTKLYEKVTSVGDEELFDCSHCGLVYRDKLTMINHEIKEHKVRYYSCNKCDFKDLRKPVLRFHSMIHQNDEIDNFSCGKCNLSYKTMFSLNRHNLERHINNDNHYKCKEVGCKSKFSTEQKLNNHYISHHSMPPYCKICKKDFLTLRRLNKHLLKLHSETLPAGSFVTCNHCDSRFARKYNLIKHLESCPDKYGTFFYKCEIPECDYKHKNVKCLKNHMISRHSTTAFLCDIPGCNRSYHLPSSLRIHKKTAHTGKAKFNQKFHCKICNGLFKAKAALTMHIRSHKKLPPIICQFCGKNFKTKRILNIHCLRKHSDAYDYECNYCKRKFKLQMDLTIHLRHFHPEILPNGAAFTCTICKKKFQTMRNLTKHMKNHPPTTYECDYCGFKTKRKTKISDHIARRHQPLSDHVCKICGTAYAVSHDLRNHMRKKHGKINTVSCENYTTFTCDYCEKNFSNKRYLRYHMKCHYDEPSKLKGLLFNCKICNKSTTKETGFRKHVKKQHGDTVFLNSKIYKCTECSKTYSWVGTLVKHMKIHSIDPKNAVNLIPEITYPNNREEELLDTSTPQTTAKKIKSETKS